MARIPVVLAEHVDYGFEGGARYQTEINEFENGYNQRDIDWQYGVHEYSASIGNMPDEARDVVLNLLHVVKGQGHAFLFRDWNDYAIRDQPLQVLPGTTSTVQLYKRYTAGPAHAYRPIQALDTTDTAPVITDANGDPVAGTFDVLTGQFTPDGAWGAGEYRLTCDFYVWVRLGSDFNPMVLRSWQSTTASLDLVEDPFEFTPTNVPGDSV